MERWNRSTLVLALTTAVGAMGVLGVPACAAEGQFASPWTTDKPETRSRLIAGRLSGVDAPGNPL